MEIPGLYNYWIVVLLMMIGFYAVIARGNLVKKIIGLNIFQVSVFVLYISMGVVKGGPHPSSHRESRSIRTPCPMC